MKLKRKMTGVAGFLVAAIGAQAAQITQLDWQFGSTANPATPTFTQNPSGAAAQATVNVGTSGAGYYFGAIEGDATAYGDRTGSWAVGGSAGSYKLDLAAYTATPGSAINYTVSITEFVGNAGTLDFFPGAYNFNISGGTKTGTVTVGTVGDQGSWVKDTWTFSVTPDANTPLSLTITPTANGGLYVDRLEWDVAGDLTLTPVPEPILTQSLAAAGLVVFGFWARSRRKV